MVNLQNLYDGHKLGDTNPLCEGCSILEKNKPCHAYLDYEKVSQCDVLFLSDSLKYKDWGKRNSILVRMSTP